MKKFLPYIFILVVAIGLFGFAFLANASVVNPGVPTSIAAPDPTAGASSCSLFSYGTWGDCITNVLAQLMLLVFQLISLLLWLAGSLLNFIVSTTIVNMAAHINGGVASDGTQIVGMAGINIAWKVIRDLMNIAFIFILVYEGIKMIIGLSDVSKVRTFITGVVLASLLINFSLFFTKVIIDASNIVTIGVYNSILSDTNSSGTTGGLSNAYQQSLGTQGFMSADFLNGTTSYGKLTIVIMASILILITSFVFLAISVLLVVRYIVLILLLILSPVAYMGMALPSMRKYADQWWESLWGQVLFAPVYMLMTWVILILINSDGFSGLTTQDKTAWASFVSSNGAPTASSSSIGLFFNFALIIGLTITSLIIAKQFSTKGAGQIKDLTSKATTFAGGAILGSTARLGRTTIGRLGNAAANNEDLKERAKTSTVARIQLAAANRAANSSFDARATGQFQNIAKQTGIDFGKADSKKENFRSIREVETKAEIEKTKQYKPSDAEYTKARAADQAIKDAAQARLNANSYTKDADGNKTREEDEKKAKSNDNEKAVNKIFEDRVKAAAARLEHSGEIKSRPIDEKGLQAARSADQSARDEAKRALDAGSDLLSDAAIEALQKQAKSRENEKRGDYIPDESGKDKAKRYAANLLAMTRNSAAAVANVSGVSVLGMSAQAPRTKSEREALALAVKASARTKGNQEKFIEAAKALAAEAVPPASAAPAAPAGGATGGGTPPPAAGTGAGGP